jgi:hypothetical protein
VKGAIAIALGALVFLSAGGSVAQAPVDEESTCVSCHEVEEDEAMVVPVPEWRESVHAEHLVSCDACHGGDPRLEDGDESMSEEAGFLDNPSWTELADYCGVCHEGIGESYTAGRFGRAIEDGVRVATCATCHMQDGHRIVTSSPGQLITSETCPDCPTLADPAAALAVLESTRAAATELALGIAGVEQKGIDLTDFRRDLRQVHASFARSVHEFDDAGIDAARALAVTQYSGIGEQVAALDREADSRLRLGFALLAALALLFVALSMSLRNAS